MAKLYLDRFDPKKASDLLSQIPSPTRIDDLIELAVLYKRSGRFADAHSVFASNYDMIKDNAKAVHEYAQTKLKLSMSSTSKERATKQRLTRDAVELLRRAIHLSNIAVGNPGSYSILPKELPWLRLLVTE